MNRRKLRTIHPAGVTLVEGYPVPAGGSSNTPPPPANGGGEGGGDGDGDDGAAGEGSGGGDAGEEDGDDGQGDPGRAGGEQALRADLANERRRRQAAEREAAELRQQHETDSERREREAREQALGPARAMVRRSAVRVAAQEVGFVDPADAVAALLASGELDEIEVADDRAEVADSKAVRATLEKLGKDKPHLLTDEARARLTGTQGSPSGGSDLRDVANNGNRGKGADPSTQFTAAIRGKLRR